MCSGYQFGTDFYKHYCSGLSYDNFNFSIFHIIILYQKNMTENILRALFTITLQ